MEAKILTRQAFGEGGRFVLELMLSRFETKVVFVTDSQLEDEVGMAAVIYQRDVEEGQSIEDAFRAAQTFTFEKYGLDVELAENAGVSKSDPKYWRNVLYFNLKRFGQGRITQDELRGHAEAYRESIRQYNKRTGKRLPIPRVSSLIQ